MNYIPLLSIAIATKNREKYCIAAIESVLSYNDNRLEICIADNSATTVVKEFVEKLNSTQIKYSYDSGGVSSIENFNRAVGLTTGEYLILIGDDDTILPKAIEIAAWAKENNVDSICAKDNVIYYWPNSRDIYPTGHLIITKSTGKIIEVDIKKELKKLLNNGLQHYLLYPLPKTYHGIVKKSLMEEIKNRTGHYYGALSPDIYSCIAMSCVAQNHYLIGEPLSVAGVCATSTTADNFTGKHSGSIDKIPHLKHRGNYIWHSLVPRYYSVNTIWAESGLTALEELGENNLLKRYNLYQMLAQGYVNNYKFIPDLIKKESNKLRKNHNIFLVTYYFKLSIAFFKIFFKKITYIIKNKMNPKISSFKDDIKDFNELFAFVKKQ
jgi:glycosyltransferase involved in cell wall biosynthesis